MSFGSFIRQRFQIWTLFENVTLLYALNNWALNLNDNQQRKQTDECSFWCTAPNFLCVKNAQIDMQLCSYEQSGTQKLLIYCHDWRKKATNFYILEANFWYMCLKNNWND